MPSGTKISLREGEEPAFEAFEHESEESAIRDITAKDIDGTGSALFETSKAGQYRVEVELRVTVTSSTGTESISERTAGLNITVIE
jgi:hypothetical protein